MSDENINDPYQSMVEGKDNDMVNEIKSNGLGKASMAAIKDPEVASADLHLGWVDLDLTELPSGGRFYPADARLKIRSARVAEIRHFSTIDENNIIDADEKLTAIVTSCTQVSGTKFSIKDIIEEDRFYIILSIRDLTFPEPEMKLSVKHQLKDGSYKDVEVKREYFDFFKIPGEIEKYYDEEKRTFVIQTRSFGNIEMRPPSLGVMAEVTKYIKERQEKNLNVDQSLIQVLPYLVSDWRSFNAKAIFNLEVDMSGWDHRKYSLVYKLAEQMRVGIKPEMVVPFGDEVEDVPINFRDGIKSLFIVQDIAGELL
jgi:hypothetical protein